jgi:hypothetical protein
MFSDRPVRWGVMLELEEHSNGAQGRDSVYGATKRDACIPSSSEDRPSRCGCRRVLVYSIIRRRIVLRENLLFVGQNFDRFLATVVNSIIRGSTPLRYVTASG